MSAIDRLAEIVGRSGDERRPSLTFVRPQLTREDYDVVFAALPALLEVLRAAEGVAWKSLAYDLVEAQRRAGLL